MESKPLVPNLRFPEFLGAPRWERSPLVKLADFVNEKVPVASMAVQNYVSTENLLPAYGGVSTASKLPAAGSVTRYRSGDVLISNIRPYLKKVWHADRGGGASNDVIVLRSKGALSETYLFLLLANDAFISYLARGAKGVKMPRGDVDSMRAYSIAFPEPAEQQKIAECLTSLDELIATEGRKLEALRAHKKGLMQNLFPREGETVPRLRFPEFRDAPWDVLNGNHLFDTVDRRPAPLGLPVLAITQEQGAISRDDIDYHVSVTAASLASYKEVRPADFIISLRSFQGGIEYSRVHGICSPAYVLLKRKGDGSDDFYRQLFKSPRFIQQITRNIEGLRDGKMISYKQFSEQLLPAPSPPEQQKIAECLASLDELISAERRKLEALRTYKKGLMQNLFPREGETTPRLRFPDFRDDGQPTFKQINKFAKVTTGDKDTQNKVADGKYPFFVRSQNVERIDSSAYDGEAILTSGDGVGVGENYHYINGKFDFHQRVYCIHKFDEGMSGEFFYYYFSTHFKKRVKQMSAKNSVDSIRMAMITEMPIWMPEISVQQRIADCLGSLDALVTAQMKKTETLKLHKQGLMQGLFPSSEVGLTQGDCLQ